VGKPPSTRKLKQFIDRGGYATLETMGTGKTAEEKQRSGWQKHGVISKLEEKTRISRQTLYKIKTYFPTSKSTGMFTGIWIKPEGFKELEAALTCLENIEEKLKTVREYFDRSLVVDLLKLRARQELLGETVEDFRLALKEQVEAGKQERTHIEELLHAISIDFHTAQRSIALALPTEMRRSP
jgi:hypothetical protein